MAFLDEHCPAIRLISTDGYLLSYDANQPSSLWGVMAWSLCAQLLMYILVGAVSPRVVAFKAFLGDNSCCFAVASRFPRQVTSGWV